MKIKTVLSLALFSSLTCASHAASSLAFPGQPNPDPYTTPNPSPVTPGDYLEGVLNVNWTTSGGFANSDLHGFYVDIGGYHGVGIGSLVNDYTDVASSVSISSNTATVGVSGSTVSDWFFQINAPTLDAPDRNAFSFVLAGTSGSLISIDLAYNVTNSNWDTYVNTVNAGAIYEGGLYRLTAAFGAGTGVSGTITNFAGDNTLPFNDSGLSFGAADFTSLTVTATKGAGAWGNGYLSVVPEPSSTMLVSLVPAFFILRRRR